jgi:hypothetical protein
MPKHLYLVVLLTFAIGLSTGFMVFLQTREKQEEDNKTPPSVIVNKNAFEILGYRYGGCERTGCTSYRITDNGVYSFITRTGGSDRRYEDSISKKRLTELSDAVRRTNLNRVLETQYTGICPAAYDAVAYRYEILFEGNRYSFDSCREDIDGELLFIMLSDYFEIFSVTHRNE